MVVLFGGYGSLCYLRGYGLLFGGMVVIWGYDCVIWGVWCYLGGMVHCVI